MINDERVFDGYLDRVGVCFYRHCPVVEEEGRPLFAGCGVSVVFYDAVPHFPLEFALGKMVVERYGGVRGIGIAFGDYFLAGKFALRFPVVSGFHCGGSFYFFFGALPVVK